MSAMNLSDFPWQYTTSAKPDLSLLSVSSFAYPISSYEREAGLARSSSSAAAVSIVPFFTSSSISLTSIVSPLSYISN